MEIMLIVLEVKMKKFSITAFKSFLFLSTFFVLTSQANAGLLSRIESDVKHDAEKVKGAVEKGVHTVEKDVGKVISFTEAEAKKTSPKVFNALSTAAQKIKEKAPAVAGSLLSNRDKIERVIQVALTEGKPAEDILNLVINEVPVIGPLVDFGGNEVLDLINAAITADLALQGK
jgi:hypothetical protein